MVRLQAGDVVVTVLVPDGTWQGARAIAVDVLRRHSLLAESISPPLEQRIPCVALDAAAVSNHRSPLIEALKSGQGMGRITTLEACGLMLREAGDPQAAEGLLGALQPLVDYVRAMLAPQPSPLPRLSGEPHPRPSFPEKSVLPILADPGAREMSKWSSALQRVARAVPEAHAGVHHALRFCVVCGDNLATPDRMQPHLRGRRHCEAVARRHLSIQRCAKSDPPKEPEVCGDGSITDERALEVLAKYSAGPLLEWPPEPPDVALVALRNTARRACQPAEPGRPRTSQANGQPSP